MTVAACQGDVRDHLSRGDRLLSSGRAEAALAEYQVALRQLGGRPEVLSRLAHGYAHVDRLDEASDYYARLLAVDSSYADQAVADFLSLAKRALQKPNRARLARALEQVDKIRPGSVPLELSLPFARYYYELGEYAPALPLYLAVVAGSSDSVETEVRYELARVYYELGECGQALEYYRTFLREQLRGELSGDARWHAGDCAYRLAQKDRLAGRPGEALAKYDLVIALGAPRALLDDAWFERGELMFSLGRFDEASRSYQRVLDLNPSRTGRRVRKAEERMRTIRYSRREGEEQG